MNCFFLAQASVGKKEKSRGLFYKALQNCPWAKVSIEKNINLSSYSNF